MAGADPEHVRTRLTVANAFVHPIRSYTTGRGNTASGDAAAPSRRQQLKRGKWDRGLVHGGGEAHRSGG